MGAWEVGLLAQAATRPTSKPMASQRREVERMVKMTFKADPRDMVTATFFAYAKNIAHLHDWQGLSKGSEATIAF
jgi:hypothetical protein